MRCEFFGVYFDAMFAVAFNLGLAVLLFRNVRRRVCVGDSGEGRNGPVDSVTVDMAMGDESKLLRSAGLHENPMPSESGRPACRIAFAAGNVHPHDVGLDSI